MAMPSPMAPRPRAGIRRNIWGYFMGSEREHDSDSEDCASDDDGALDLGDIVDASADGTIARTRTNKWKTIPFHLYETNETLRVRGRFIMSDPWWAARMTVVKRNDLWELCGNVRYSMRDDHGAISDKVVPLFLTSCDVHTQHLQLFTEAISSIGKTNELTFKTLPDLLGEFAAMSDTNRDVADQIQHQISGLKGAMVTSYNGLELFYELMPLLLPKKFTSFVEMKKYSGATLERLQEALRDDLWVFGYSNVLGSRFKVYSCEATLEAYTSSGLVDKLSPVERDALYIYDTLKACCRRSGHTFVPDVKLRSNHRPACSHKFEDWDAAIKFLVQHKVISLEPGQGHQRVYLYRLWKAEQDIALGIRQLFQEQSNRPWDLDVNLDSAQFKDIQEDADQMRAAKKIVSKPVVVISGAGGCGKTHVVSKIFHHVQHQRYVEEEFDLADIDDFSMCHMTPDTDTSSATPETRQNASQTPDMSSTPPTDDLPGILMTAPTGKVANLLGQRSRVPGYTLHQVMFSFYSFQKKQKAGSVNAEEKWKFSDVEVLIADECSLISVQMFAAVLNLLLTSAKLRKLVLLGDIKQLPSIEPGNFLADMYVALWTVDSSIMLSTNHRSESQLIVDNADRISQRQCPVIDQAGRFCQTTIDENRDHSKEYPECDRDVAIRKLLKEQPDLHCHETSQFIAFRRRDCEAINELCCKHYCKHSLFEKQRGRRRRLFQVGDKVCCTKNGYVRDHSDPEKGERRLCNGEIFFIRHDRTIQEEGNRKTQRLLVLDDLRSTCEVDMRDLNNCGLRHSWARTIHTFQGSEVNTLVYVVGPAGCQTWQHVYTAVTRGRNRVTLVTRQSDLVIAVKRQPQRRNTSLREKMGEQLKDLGVAATVIPNGPPTPMNTAPAMSKFTNATIPIEHSNGSLLDPTSIPSCTANSIPSCTANTAPTEKDDGLPPTSPFSDWGDADSQDMAALETVPLSPETPGNVTRTPTKRRITEMEPVTDSSIYSPLKRSLAKLNF